MRLFNQLVSNVYALLYTIRIALTPKTISSWRFRSAIVHYYTFLCSLDHPCILYIFYTIMFSTSLSVA